RAAPPTMEAIVGTPAPAVPGAGSEAMKDMAFTLVVPPASTYVDRWSLAPPGTRRSRWRAKRDRADPQESLWDFKWSRGQAGGERSETVQPGGDQRPPGGVRTCRRGH